MNKTRTQKKEMVEKRRWIISTCIAIVAILVVVIIYFCDKKEIDRLAESNRSLDIGNQSLTESVRLLNETIISQRDSIAVKDKEIEVLIKTLHNHGIFVIGDVTNSTLTDK